MLSDTVAKNYILEIKTSNNPVEKITACPLAGVSRWLMPLDNLWMLQCNKQTKATIQRNNYHMTERIRVPWPPCFTSSSDFQFFQSAWKCCFRKVQVTFVNKSCHSEKVMVKLQQRQKTVLSKPIKILSTNWKTMKLKNIIMIMFLLSRLVPATPTTSSAPSDLNQNRKYCWCWCWCWC